jgi:hypothetical protein
VLGGVLHIENLHKYVTESKQIVSKIDFSKERDRAEMLKAQLLVILENYDKATKNPPGWKKHT